MSDATQELVALKQTVKDLQNKKARLQGQFDEIKRQLKDTYNISTLKKAKEYIKDNTDEVRKLSDIRDAKIKKAQYILTDAGI